MEVGIAGARDGDYHFDASVYRPYHVSSMALGTLEFWLAWAWLLLAWLARNVPLMSQLLKFPLIKIVLVRPHSLTDSPGGVPRTRMICWAKVVNVGTAVAENCYPQLLSVETLDGRQVYSAEPLLWERQDELDYDLTYHDIPPGDAGRGFQLVEGRGSLVELPIARYPGGNHRVLTFMPGIYVFRMNIVGDNFRCRPFAFEVSAEDRGDDTWRTLVATEWRPSRLRGLFDKFPKLKRTG